ncbi:MAG: nuclear transport factor 2 family protein [Nitrososphaerales archaeon]|jgi:ketosteroid isomerase-like protein
MKADAETERVVLALLRGFSDSFGAKDVDGALRLFARDAEVVMMGSEDWEMGVGYEGIRAVFNRLLSRTETYRWDWRWRAISTSGSVAWVLATGDCHTRNGETETLSPYRLSGVFEKRGETWLWVLFHGSEPMPTAKE